MEKAFTVNYAIKKLKRCKKIKRINLSQYSYLPFNFKNWVKYSEDK
jgi:uncharacterized protein YlbG (UPF0298 family)